MILKSLLIGFVAIIPGVMVMSIASRLELYLAIPLFIILQFVIGYFTNIVVKRTSNYNLGSFDGLFDIRTNAEVARGYIEWVSENKESFNEEETKLHYDNARKITDTLHQLNESNRDTVTK